MTVNEIQTPAILLNLEAMEHNIKKYAKEAKNHNQKRLQKSMWKEKQV